jgi:hypothetical protein
LAKHLPAAGWTPVVVCVDEAFHEELPDHGLASLVPRSVEILKVSALSPRLCRPLGLGEISLRAWRTLRSAVFSLLETRDVGVVLITGSPFYPMLMAAQIKRRFDVPVVLDFQDPWVSSWGAKQPRFSKKGLSHALAVALEPHVVGAADFITSVSDAQNGEMLRRYPKLPADRFLAIPIGGDPEDFEALGAYAAKETDDLLAKGKLNFSFVGTCMPRSGPLMRIFLQGVRQFRLERPDLAKKVRFNFIGTGNHSAAKATPVSRIAFDVGVEDLVFEMPERISFSRALSALVASDVVLIIGSDEAHYTASKIYPGLMSGRPFLSIFHLASSSHAILRDAGGGIALSYDPLNEASALSTKVAAALVKLVCSPCTVGTADPDSYKAYTANSIAGQFAHIFDTLTLK